MQKELEFLYLYCLENLFRISIIRNDHSDSLFVISNFSLMTEKV